MKYPAYEIYKEYEKDKYKTSIQKKAEKVLSEAKKDKGKSRESSLEFQDLIEREADKLKEFFGYAIEVPPLPDEVTIERYDKWKEMGLELHYLPDEELTEERDLPGWLRKPGKKYTKDQNRGIEYFDEVRDGNLPPNTLKLPSSWILVDTREKPKYQDGNQKYDKDILSKTLEDLRTKGIITNYKTKDSRFNISWDELHNPEVKKAIANALDVREECLRLTKSHRMECFRQYPLSQMGRYRYLGMV